MISCPDRQVLQSFLCGKLSDADIDSVESHLEVCADCNTILPTLDVRDELVATVHRLTPQLRPNPLDARVEALIHDLCGIAAEADTTEVICGDDDTETPAALPVEFECPDIPGYEILERLGHGGMGVVCKARHRLLGKLMALKLLPPREPISTATLGRFKEEMLALGQLNHPNIVQAHDAGDVNGVPYLAMEYLDGTDVAKLVQQQGRLPVALACDIVRQAALGLQYASEHGLVHRDVKPSNLFLGEDGVVKIVDLGISRLVDRRGATVTYRVAGTPDYMAPEQWLDDGDVDFRADLYGLGCTLYHLLAGFPPFAEFKHTEQKQKAHLLRGPRPIREVRPGVPPTVAQLVDRLLAKNPAERPEAPAEVAVTLAAFCRRRTPRSQIISAIGACLAAFALCAALVLRLVTDDGTLILETDDNDVEVLVKQQGRLVQISDKKTGRALTLRAGVYELEATGGKPGMTITPERITIRRGDRPIATVAFTPRATWSCRSPLIKETSSCGTAEINGRIYVVGGHKSLEDVTALQAYDPADTKWRMLAPLPKLDAGSSDRYGGTLGAIDGRLYLAGGWRNRDVSGPSLPTDTLLIYDPAKNEWRAGRPMPIRSGSSAGSVIRGKLYVMTTSVGEAGHTNFVHVYDPTADVWRRLPSPSEIHQAAATAVVADKLYVLGGLCLGSTTVEAFDPATERWQARRPMPEPRLNASAVTVGRKLYVVGGRNNEGKLLNSVAVYDPAADEWSTLDALLNTPRLSLGLTAIGKTLYAIGGSNGDGITVLGSVEALELRD